MSASTPNATKSRPTVQTDALLPLTSCSPPSQRSEVVGEDKDPISARDGLPDVYSIRPPISEDPNLLLTYTIFFRGSHDLRCVQREGKALHRVDEFLEFI